MTVEKLINSALKRGAAHVRILTLSEGLVAVALFLGWYILFEIMLDHVFSLSVGSRAVLLAAMLTLGAVVVGYMVVGPLAATVNRLYVARRVETAFPDFKNSLTTFVELPADNGGAPIRRLVGYQAAGHFQGVDIDAGLDSTRFVRLGYAFVLLIISFFVYSLLTPKSMWTSFLRAIHPWSDVAAPTRTHINDVRPGSVMVLLGSHVPVSAEISGVEPPAAFVKWSRDGELWQSVPMQKDGDRWAAFVAHVETNIVYCVSAGDCVSQKYSVTALAPPLVDSVSVDVSPPAYTRLSPRRTPSGNIEAPVGSAASIEIRSNKELSSVSLKIPPDTNVPLEVTGSVATGAFEVSRSGRYAVMLTDAEGLSPAAPVEYDIVAIPDRAPLVAAGGPADDETVPLDAQLPFHLEASDDYGVTRLVLHFASDPSNADVKNYILPPGMIEVQRDSQLVPALLGAQPGDTVSYFVEALDNRDDKPNSARTPTYTFKVARGKESLMASSSSLPVPGVKQTGSSLPGTPEPASGTPGQRNRGPTKTAASPGEPGTPGASAAAADVLDMIEKDRGAWETIARHFPDMPSPAGSEVAEAAQAPPADTAGSQGEQGAPSPAGRGASPAKTSQPAQGTSSPASAGSPEGPGGSQQSAKPEPQGGRVPTAETPPTGQAQVQRPAVGGTAENKTSPGAVTAALDASAEAPGESAKTPEPRSGAASPGEPSEGQPSKSKDSQPPPSSSRLQGGGRGVPQTASTASGQPSPSPEGQSSSENSQGTPEAPAQASSSPQGQAQAGGSKSPSQASAAQGQSAQSSSATGKPDAAGGPPGGAAPGGAQGAESQALPDVSSSRASSSVSASPSATASSKPAAGETAGAAPGAAGGTPDGLRPIVPETSRPGTRPSPERAVIPVISPDVRIAAARRILTTLSGNLAAGRVDPSLLKDLGWQPSELRTFVRRYEDILGEIAPAPFEGQIILEGSIDSGSVLAGQRGAGSVGSLDTRGRPLEDKSAAPGNIPREDVAPQYRRILDEYYRSLAQTNK